MLFIDDIAIYDDSSNVKAHLDRVTTVLTRLASVGFKVSMAQFHLAITEGSYLGFYFINGLRWPMEDQRKKILATRKPKTATELRSFLGLANFSRSFVKTFATICTPLYQLLTKVSDIKTDWGSDHDAAFVGICN